MRQKPIYDEYDPWATYQVAPVVRRHPRRQRKPTLASILKQAAKAGAGAVVRPDGSVVLEITGSKLDPIITTDVVNP